MQIEIPEPLLRRLQEQAIPFVDTTPVSVIERWADFYEQHNKQKLAPNGTHQNREVVSISHDVRQLDSKRPPSLRHTRVRGEFGTTTFSEWNELLRISHIQAFKNLRSFEELRKTSVARIRKGPYLDEGYRYIPEIDISIQGVDADRAWEYALRLAIHLKVPVKAEIEWRLNDKAAHPGERGIMVWTP